MHRLNTVHLESALAQQETELASCATSQRNGTAPATSLQINAKSIFKSHQANFRFKDEPAATTNQTDPISVSNLEANAPKNPALETEVLLSS
jgi:hypothetical protein